MSKVGDGAKPTGVDGARKQRVQGLMQQRGIRARGKRRFWVAPTDGRHDLPIAPNLLNPNFTPSAPNRRGAGEITYLATGLFLAVVILNRKISDRGSQYASDDYRQVLAKHGIHAR